MVSLAVTIKKILGKKNNIKKSYYNPLEKNIVLSSKQGFVKGESCQTKLISFSDRVAGQKIKGKQ